MFTVEEVAQYLGCEVSDQRVITGIEFDSRAIQPGNLFVPLAGARDGHEFVQQAVTNGAIATLWSQPGAATPEEISVIAVPNVLQAFQQLATIYRQKVQPKVVAITGSNGKTTTKDMTEAVLAQRYRTHKTQGNYNNEIGMPYTILHMPADTEVLILEMGMDHAGDLQLLSTIAQPDIAAITLIGEAHIENLGSRAAIAQGKMEITQGLTSTGTLLIPADEPLLTPLVASLTQQVMTFGIGVGDLTATITEELRDETSFIIADEAFTIPVLGSYNVKNALIAYGIGQLLAVPVEQIAIGLAHFHLTKNRTQWHYTDAGVAILSDVYNANPTAMGLVLDSFGKLPGYGRRFAVLADMLELGAASTQMHAAMANHISDYYDGLFLVGEQMDALAKELEKRGSTVTLQLYDVTEKAALIQDLQRILKPQDMILLKGSNGMGLAEVVEALVASVN